eukprot:TRINITY_DN11751_c0_g1_i4.p1 TRINITY_DN11751_c0_g1~~TRINITY_DN11751_c0_g1_i4.p1  ORF type:complete len:1011 (+),score=220.71 TRINITY_DN11751_c0_g1_i4:192-3224(+)
MAAPEVSGLSPSVGPSTGGTVVVVRGSNLGNSEDDITDVTVAGISVRDSLQYFTPSRIKITTPRAQGSGPVIVTTVEGGAGICLLTFTFETVIEDEEEQSTTVGYLEECDVWKDELPEQPLESDLNPAATVDRDPLKVLRKSHERSMEDNKTIKSLSKTYQNASAMMSSKAFEPALLFATTYKDVTRDDLEQGLSNLEEGENAQDEAFEQLLSVHSGTFVRSFAALSDVHEAVAGHKRRAGTPVISEDLGDKLVELRLAASQLFEPVLTRQEHANGIRNALSMVTANKMLFGLPESVKSGIQAENWSQVIQDYRKAKQHFAGTDNEMFQKILAQVEGQMLQVEHILYGKLADAKTPLSVKEQLVDYLRGLNREGQPEWFCITKMNEHIDKLLKHHLQRLLSAAAMSGSGNNSRRRWSKLRNLVRMGALSHGLMHHRRESFSDPTLWMTSLHQEHMDTPPSPTRKRASSLSKTQPKRSSVVSFSSQTSNADSVSNSNEPARVQFVERITKVVLEQLPSLWKLAQVYFPAVTLKTAKAQPKLRRRSKLMAELEVDGEEAIKQARTEQIKGFVKTTIETYTEMIETYFIEADDDRELINMTTQHWLPKMVEALGNCYRTCAASSLPKPCLKRMETTLSKLHRWTLAALFQICEQDISLLSIQEDWVPLESKTGTRIVDLFETYVLAALDSLSAFTSTNSIANLGELSTEIENHFCATFVSLCNCMRAMVFDENGKLLILKSALSDDASVTSDLPHSKSNSIEHRLLCVVANAFALRDVVSHRLVKKYDALKLDLTSTFDATMGMVADLQNSALEALVRRLSQRLIRMVQDGMGTFPLSNQLEPRDHVKGVLFELVCLHANIRDTAQGFVDRVLTALTNKLAEAVHDNLETIDLTPSLTKNQVTLEIFALKRALDAYDTDPSLWTPCMNKLKTRSALAQRRASMKGKRSLPTPGAKRPSVRRMPSIDRHLIDWDNPPNEIATQLEYFLQANRLQYSCFQGQHVQDAQDDSDVEV